MTGVQRIRGAYTDELFAASKGYVTLSNLLPILGPPSKPMDFNPTSRQRFESWSLAQAYAGKAYFYETTLSTMIRETHNPEITQYILPLVETDDMTWKVQHYHEQRGLAPQTAPEAPPEYVTSSSSVEEFGLQRYALGTRIGTEELKTLEGQVILLKNMNTVGMTIADTIEQVSLMALTSAKLYWNEYMRLQNATYSNLEDAFAWEVAMFGIVQKEPRGYWTLSEEVKKTTKEYIMTHVLVPEGTRSLIALDPVEQEYYRAGPDARDNVKRGGDAVGNVGANGIQIITVREWGEETSGAPIAPLRRERVIGDMWKYTNYGRCAAAVYRTCMRDTSVFDMGSGRGVFTMVRFMDMVAASGRWEPDGSLHRVHKLIAAAPEHTLQEAGLKDNADRFLDMFLYMLVDKTGYGVVEFLGQMEPQALSDEAVRDAAMGVLHVTGSALTDADHKALRDGFALIDEMHARAYVAATDATHVEAASSGRAGADGVLEGNEYGGPKLSGDQIRAMVAATGTPFGFGSVPGLRTLAKGATGAGTDAASVRVAVAFNRALEKYYDVVSGLMPASHPAINPAHVPAFFRSGLRGARGGGKNAAADRQDAITVLAQNLLDHAKLPLHKSTAAGAPAALDFALPAPAPPATALFSSEAKREARAREIFTMIAPRITTLARRTFGSAAALATFLDEFKASPLARAWAGSQPEGDTRTTDFDMFLITYVDNSGIDGAWQLANWLDHVVAAAQAGSPVSKRDVRRMLDTWSAEPDTAEVARGLGQAASHGVITRLVAPVSATLLAGDLPLNFALASPFDITRVINTAQPDEVAAAVNDSRRNPAHAFLHARAAPFAHSGTHEAAAAVGGKRGRGAFEDDDCDEEEEGGRRRRGGAGSRRERAPPMDEYEAPMMGDTFNDAAGASALPANGLAINDNLSGRYLRAAIDEKDPLVRAATHLVLLAPVHLKTFTQWAARNVVVPFDVLAVRPNMRFQTGSMIYAAPNNGELGVLAYMPPDVQMGGDPITKSMTFHVSMWFGPVIAQPARYFIAADVIISGYGGGAGVRPYTPETWSPADFVTSGGEENGNDASVFALLNPYGSLRHISDVIDIRGHFDAELLQGRQSASRLDGSDLSKPHYPSAPFYNALYHFNDLHTLSVAEGDYYRQKTGSRNNTVVFQGHQWLWKHATADYSNIIINKGHLGPNIAEGLGEILTMGRAKHFEQMNYKARYTPVE